MPITRTQIHPCCILKTPLDIICHALLDYDYNLERSRQKTNVLHICLYLGPHDGTPPKAVDHQTDYVFCCLMNQKARFPPARPTERKSGGRQAPGKKVRSNGLKENWTWPDWFLLKSWTGPKIENRVCSKTGPERRGPEHY